MSKNSNLSISPVIIAGAGPGDPELITAKAIRHLGSADIILTDRLVSDTILQLYANKKAEIIYVGKQCRKGASTPQAAINRLMVEYALSGKKVVRLKGGDVSVFSNILDELEVLKTYNIPYEIVPGITAALGAAAYAGMPLTARDYSTAVRLLTYYKKDIITDAYWKDLATTTDTLVFYMSAETVGEVVEHLIQNGITEDVHIAVIEQATTPLQRVYTCPVHQFKSEYAQHLFISPSLVVIGKVVALHAQFGWINNSIHAGSYFTPLTSILSSIPHQNNEVYVSRA
jgi:uroporphyrin-III C-methyltransferase